MPTFAAIDVGSNSCRLKISKLVAHDLKTLYEDREVTRLGAGVFERGQITPDSMAATVSTLKRFQRAVQDNAVDSIRVTATAAMRVARNAAAFQAWVKAETGWTMEIISGLEEARLIHLGVISNETSLPDKLLLSDLGGGSCEVTLSERRRIKDTVSMHLGAVRLTEQFLNSDPPSSDDLNRMKKFVHVELMRAHHQIRPPSTARAIFTSGTASALHDALVAMRAQASAKTPAKGAGKAKRAAAPLSSIFCPRQDVRKLAIRLAKLPLQERLAVPGIGPRRAEIIIAGAMVFAELLELFDMEGFYYSAYGLRDGILEQMLAEQDARSQTHREFEQERWESVVATAKRFGVDPRKVEPVRSHAAQLFRELRPLHELPAEYETWISAAALLSETGKFINHQGHHRHSQYIISSSEIYGCTPLQRTIISAIARYLGKSQAAPSDRAMRNIPAEEHPRIHRAIVLLRLAQALNQDRASDVLRVSAKIFPKRVYFEIEPGRTGAELELWSLRREADYFLEVFGRELFAALA